MLRPPPAVRESMERARLYPRSLREYAPLYDALRAEARRTTREILRALEALRREERAGLLGGK